MLPALAEKINQDLHMLAFIPPQIFAVRNSINKFRFVINCNHFPQQLDASPCLSVTVFI